MRIPCPYCGERDSSEFSYLGDAQGVRPEARSPGVPEPAGMMRFHDAVYLRDNPAGPHGELWYHAFGCRRWLHVQRDTRTHAVHPARFAGEAS